jgi:hypothetical protein
MRLEKYAVCASRDSNVENDSLESGKKCREFLQSVEEFHVSECESGTRFTVEKRSCELVPIRD